MKPLQPEFWRHKTLAEMDSDEWEALCDGCAKCCLYRLEEEETGRMVFTNVRCRLLDPHSCRCSDYANRQAKVPDCVAISLRTLANPGWLPRTCAYRLLAEGRDLPEWHPLLTGSERSVVQSGHSARGRTIHEDKAGPLEHHLVDWFV